MKPALAFFLATTLATASHAGLTTDIEYAKVANESLKLDAYQPEGPGPFPAVILVHGGGWRNGDKSGGPKKGSIVPLFEPLQKAGFAWFSIDYRLAPKHTYPACIEDVEAAIRWIKAHATEYHVDRKRIALLGESAGGHLVALAAVRADDSTRVAAVVPFFGVFDMTSFANRTGAPDSAIAMLFGHEPDESIMPVLREASPITQVKSGLPHFLLLHGDADCTVPLEQTVRFLAKLRDVEVPSDLIVVPNAPHGMRTWTTFMPDYRERIVAWLEKTMGLEKVTRGPGLP